MTSVDEAGELAHTRLSNPGSVEDMDPKDAGPAER